MTTTRLQCFLDIASELGDLITLTATGSGTTTTFVSTSDMLYPDGSLNGREVWYGSGTVANLATRRLVTGTDEDTGTITVSPAWPSASATNDVVYLVNSRGTGVTIPEIHNKINQLVRRVGHEMATEVADTAATFDATDPVIDIPTSWSWLLGIEIELDPDQVNVWTRLIGNAYTVSKADSPKTVTIKPTHLALCDNKRLRLIGATDLSTLSTDASTTTVPASWLAKTAAYELLEAAALRSGDVATAFTYGELLKAQATEAKTYLGKRFSGYGRRVDLTR